MRKIILGLGFVFWCLLCAAQERRIVVDSDGGGDFTTVQAAFDAIPFNNKERITVFIRKGVYREKLHLDASKNFVTIEGEERDQTFLTWNDHTGKIAPSGDTINTFTSQTLQVRANDFTARNISIQNGAGPTAGQAVAVSILGDRAVFDNCNILGNQDTLYTGNERGRAYFRACYIDGTTDFIFGPATVLFQQCRLHSKRNSHVTAASTPKNIPFGYVFQKCTLTADTSITKATLGRPWRPYASVTYMECTIGKHIIPQGWDNWRNPANEKTARYAEYRNTGPGADVKKRVEWSRQLTKREAKKFTTKKILRGWKPKLA
jgi:pectinesterase